ncbi:MAG: MFS transporter [Desulfovibrio sp.]|jgi:MFS family permease|nr:MFS transporter [Desulfovibrio sp.]
MQDAHWAALARINALSALAQIVQIGTMSPLLSLSLQHRGISQAITGLILRASWIAILCFYKITPHILYKFGLVRSNCISAAISIAGIIGISQCTNILLVCILNFFIGIGLILRWIACDTWIVSVAAREERGRAIGLHETLMWLGIALGPLIIVDSKLS